MQRLLFYPAKRFGSLFRRSDLRPLILQVIWGLNILLFATAFLAFVFYLRNFS